MAGLAHELEPADRLTSLTCTLSPEQEDYPPPVLNRMTSQFFSLGKIDVVIYYPEVHPYYVDEGYGGDEGLAYQVEILQQIAEYTRAHKAHLR